MSAWEQTLLISLACGFFGAFLYLGSRVETLLKEIRDELVELNRRSC